MKVRPVVVVVVEVEEVEGQVVERELAPVRVLVEDHESELINRRERVPRKGSSESECMALRRSLDRKDEIQSKFRARDRAWKSFFLHCLTI